jgi:Bacteriophage HK97-gp10, putative tail-component
MLFIPITSTAIPQLIDQGVPLSDIRSVLIRVASRFTPILQKSAPVDTGALRRSLRVDLLDDDSGVALVSTVFYAGFVEFGTRKMRPRLYAQSLVPDLIGFMNLLLSELGTYQRTPILQVAVGERSNETTQSVSQEYLDRINGNRVQGGYLKPLSISGRNVNSLSVPPRSVKPESTNPEAVPDQYLL